jgi:hypothetical protein
VITNKKLLDKAGGVKRSVAQDLEGLFELGHVDSSRRSAQMTIVIRDICSEHTDGSDTAE